MVDGDQYVALLAGGNGLPYSSPRGDHLWAFRLNFGKKKKKKKKRIKKNKEESLPPAATPTPPSKRQPINAAAVAGSTANKHGAAGPHVGDGRRVHVVERDVPAAHDGAGRHDGHFPQSRKAKSTRNHCATQFFEGLFGTGPLAPGQSTTHTFTQPGEYFYNEGCSNFQPNTTGKIVVLW